MSEAAPQRLLTARFVVLMATASAFFAGAGLLNAITPLYVVDALGGSEVAAGVTMGSFAVSALLSRPWFGRLADRAGARRIIVVGGLVSATSMVVLLVGPETIATAILSRFVLGFGAAAMLTGVALRSLELAPDGRQSQASSLILVAVHVGLGLGPIIGLRVLDWSGFDAVWWTVVGCGLVSTSLAMLLTNRRPTVVPGRRPAPLVHPAALLPGVVTLFGVFSFNGFLTFASLYGREIGVADVSLLFTTASGTIVIVRLVAGGLPDRFGPIRAGSVALSISILATVVLAVWATPVGAFVGAALVACGLSLQSPSFMPLAIAGVDEHERGAAMATYTGFFDVANALVGPILGLIVAGVDYRVAFLFTGGMAAVGLAILQLAVRPRYEAAHAPT